MSDFGYVEFCQYTFVGPDYQPGTAVPVAGTILDMDNDNIFQADGTESNGPFGIYIGTWTISGIKMPVFQNGLSLTVFNPGPGFVTFPVLFAVPQTDSYSFCFAAGTGIAAPQGEIPVEQLQPGDLIQTNAGQNVAVKWIGRQTIHKVFARQRAQLVRVRERTLGAHSDLLLTAEHGLMVGGHIVNASALVNGETVDWIPLSQTPDVQTVYHIETENHDVILANGVAAETYVDMPGRMAFDNYQEYLDLFGEEQPIVENPMPRIVSRRLLPKAILDQVAAQKAA